MRLVDGRNQHEVPAFLSRSYQVVVELIAAASLLPEVVRSGSADLDEWSADSWKAQYDSLSAYFGSYNVYWEVFDPYISDDAIKGTLADCFSSIYEKIHPGLKGWEDADAGGRRMILWDWQFTFEYLWGHHAIDALRAIHSLLFTHNIDQPDPLWPPEAGAVSPIALDNAAVRSSPK